MGDNTPHHVLASANIGWALPGPVFNMRLPVPLRAHRGAEWCVQVLLRPDFAHRYDEVFLNSLEDAEVLVAFLRLTEPRLTAWTIRRKRLSHWHKGDQLWEIVSHG